MEVFQYSWLDTVNDTWRDGAAMRGRWRAPATAASGNAKDEASRTRPFVSRREAVLQLHHDDCDRTQEALARRAICSVQDCAAER